MEVQIFGTKNNSDTRKALRFFSERGWKTHFVDLSERPASPGELRRFVEKLGVDALVDRDGKRYRDLGLTAARPNRARWLELLATEPLLLRQPLVRFGPHVTLGPAEADWKGWTAP
jgi:arsenate reductase-like glutaredoxin family protein